NPARNCAGSKFIRDPSLIRRVIPPGRGLATEELRAAASGDVYRDFIMFFLKIPVKVSGSLQKEDTFSLFPPSKEKGSLFCPSITTGPCCQGKISAAGEIYRDSL
ncbi:MAG: hypothetical protein VB085_13850, partial [Peptococcaceae bacterium]|nr:hypothetical protein [Peptococcaceae bacterium]